MTVPVRIRIVRCTCPPDSTLCDCESTYGTLPLTVECDTFEQAVDLLVAQLPRVE